MEYFSLKFGFTPHIYFLQNVKNENNEEPTQVEMFIETCQGNKGKELDLET